MARVLAGAITLAMAVGGAAVVAPASAAPSLVVLTDIPHICQSEVNAANIFAMDTSKLGSGVLVLDGRTITITDDPSSWAVFDPIDNTFNNRFHGLQWLVSWAIAGGDAVSLLVARDAALPDPGLGVSSQVLRSTGWTTGASRIRQNTVNCLYEITRDDRLIKVVDGIVAVNLDPNRYRGRPLNTVHNHGMLANHALIESARVFDRPEWEDIAFSRMNADAESVFAACGMSVEQSSSYQLTNLRIWERGLRRVGSATLGVAQTVASRIDTARLAAIKLARPDGVLEAIGNANQRDVKDLLAQLPEGSLSPDDTRLWCPSRGWAANRTSWQDDAIQYTLRFGPRRKMHGHNDHGSLTWFAYGVPVLSDPGLFDKARSARHRQAVSMAAHSVMAPAHRAMPGMTPAQRLDSPEGVDRYRLDSRARGLLRTRHVQVDLKHANLRVRDDVESRWTTQWYQRWQLAPGWTPVAGTTPWTPIARHPEGLYLYAVCHSRMSMRMTTGSQEHYPKRRTVIPATTLYCGGMDRTLTFDTLLVVSDIEGTLRWDRASGAYAVHAPGSSAITPGA